jgi:hypothetical protein
MPFSSPTMMIGAANNSENVDRVNLVTLSFSLHSIPASVFFWVKIEIGDARVVSQLLHGAILNKSTVWATKWQRF